MPRKREIVMYGSLLSSAVGFFILQTRSDARFTAGREAIATMATCQTLRLGMTREDVQKVMGAPSREFQVEGPSGGAAVALRFELPIKEERFPLVVLEQGRLVEAVCAEQLRLTATREEIALMFAREAAQSDAPIGSDSVRR